MRPHLITVDFFFKAICDTFQKDAAGSETPLPTSSQNAGETAQWADPSAFSSTTIQ
jgi:hypothetical protein|tara:strand:- start:125 stop:292 length:168 start_codon:yes stop_codon:yes gene_type:complete